MGRGVWEADVIPLEQETLITEHQTWNQTRVLGNSIRVQSGVRLRIKAEVQIPEDKYIYVEKGATLIIDGGHLHNVCGKEWAGIFVEGDSDLPQGGMYNSAQGQVLMLNNAIIEGAYRGVKLIGYTPQGGIEWGTAGGLIQARNSTFKNCRKAVEFYSYHNTTTSGEFSNNKSRFVNCTFTADQGYAELFNESPLPHLTMVGLWDVEGVQFSGCTFEMPRNSENGINNDRAIASSNASFSVKPYVNSSGTLLQKSEFSGFDIAIDADNYCSLKSVEVRDALFNDNNRAITLSNVLAPVVVNNEINIGAGKGNGGIFLYETEQYTVEENKINGTGQNVIYTSLDGKIIKECGIYVRNTNSQNYNELYRNDVQNTYFGMYLRGLNHAENPNIGLEFLCNDFGLAVEAETPAQANHWDVYINGKVAKKQGRFPGTADQSTPLNQLPAGNRFDQPQATNGEGNIDVASQNGFFIQSYLMHPQEETNPEDVSPLEVFKQALQEDYVTRNSACPSHAYSSEDPNPNNPSQWTSYPVPTKLALIETKTKSMKTLRSCTSLL